MLTNNKVRAKKLYVILNRIPFMLSNCYFPIFISVHIKFQAVLSTGGIFETIFFPALQAIPYQLSRIFLTNIFYQLIMILVLIGTVNAEVKMLV